MKITIENVNAFAQVEKLTKPEMKCMFEAFRRINLMGKKVTDDDPFIGLGMPSHYDNKYFRPSFHNVRPRQLHWFRLTIDGKIMHQKMLEFFDIPTNPKELQEANLLLFKY